MASVGQIPSSEVQKGDIIRFVPLGAKRQVTIKVKLPSDGIGFYGNPARFNDDGTVSISDARSMTGSTGYFHPPKVTLLQRNAKTAAAPRRKKGIDYCKDCKGESLWSNFFDDDGLGVPDDSQPGWKWRTVCQDCGTIQ